MIDENWKWFKISDIFIMKQGKTLSKDNKDIYQGKIPCINGGSIDNGVMTYLSEDIQETGFRLNQGGCLSLSRVGNSGLTFYQKQDFFIADNGFSLRLKDDIQSDYIYLFLSTILDVERMKYCYGRIVGQKKYLKGNIKLPATSNGKPNWQWMEDYVKNTIIQKLPLKAKSVCENNYDKKPVIENKIPLLTENWKWFNLKDIFTLRKCKCKNASELLFDGDDIAYIGAKKKENGIMKYVMYDEGLVSRGNCIVFIGDGEGSIGFHTYQPVDFIGSTTLTAGYSLHLNKYTALFLVTVLDKERYRYSFGRKYGLSEIKGKKIKLPATADGSPDWQFMEEYIKSLPYSRGI